jgi:UDP:flavonoid glycosyltransferase YjiC (YdhE family)
VTNRLRVMLAVIGWTGHAFPAFGLARELHSRGHEVIVETSERWRETAEGIGPRFIAARERIYFPGLPDAPEGPSLAEAARELADRMGDLRPDVVVSDPFTLAPTLAAELTGTPTATLIPHPYPVHGPGLPLYPLGMLPARTPVGRLAWRALRPLVGTRLPNTRLRAVRAAIDATRAELGLASLRDYDGQISDGLVMVATYPQLEYPRSWPAHVHVTGPMTFELANGGVELAPDDRPLVLVAASTARDLELRLVRVALDALEGEPVRVVATTNQPGLAWREPVPDNATVVDWLSYRQAMPMASLVICHGGHGTIARALGEGTPVLVSPPAGDMAENGARVAWAGAGLMLPHRLLRAGPVRLAVRRALASPRLAERARAIAAWASQHSGAEAGADLLERYVH